MDGSKRDSSTPTTESNGTPVPFQDVQLASYAFVQDVDFDAQLAWLESKYENRKPPANPPELEKVLLSTSVPSRYHSMRELVAINDQVQTKWTSKHAGPHFIPKRPQQFEIPYTTRMLAHAAAFLYRGQSFDERLEMIVPGDCQKLYFRQRNSQARRYKALYLAAIRSQVNNKNEDNRLSCTWVAYCKLRTLFKDTSFRNSMRVETHDFEQLRQGVMMHIFDTITNEELHHAYAISWTVVSFPFLIQATTPLDSREGAIRNDVVRFTKMVLARHTEEVWRYCVQMKHGNAEPADGYRQVEQEWDGFKDYRAFPRRNWKLEDLPRELVCERYNEKDKEEHDSGSSDYSGSA